MSFIKTFTEICPPGPVGINPGLGLIMAWRLKGDKALSELKMDKFVGEYMCHWASMN